MFKAPFSFEGRIRRTEYGLSMLLYVIVITFLNAMIEDSRDDGPMFFLILLIPLLWFMWAQGAKRCHDLGNSGWWQLIPFYGVWMLFQEGHILANQYGENPKQPSFSRQAVSDESVNENHSSANPASQPSGQPTSPRHREKQLQTWLFGGLDTSGVQTTELEIQNVDYGLLQKIIDTLRAIESVQDASYEFHEETGRVTIRHNGSSEALLCELYVVNQGMKVLTVSQGTLKVKMK